MGCVVFETAVGWRVVAGGDHKAISQIVSALSLTCVVIQNRQRDGRGRCEATGRINQGNNTVASQNLERRLFGRARKRVGVFANIDRPANVRRNSVFTNRLSDCGDVPLIERTIEGIAAVTTGAKDHALFGNAGVRRDLLIGSQQSGDVNEVLRLRFLTSSIVH